MPAKDLYQDIIIKALVADGSTITHDPLYLKYGGRKLYIDLGAERDTIAASAVSGASSALRNENRFLPIRLCGIL